MEIVGLVIIVILIALGMLFMVTFALRKGPMEAKKAYTRGKIAVDTMTALLVTTTTCPPQDPQDIKSLLQDCARFSPRGNIDCDGDGRVDSCEFVNKTINNLLNKTLASWAKKYEFNSKYGTKVLASAKNKGCPATRARDSSGMYPISVDTMGKVFNILFVCD